MKADVDALKHVDIFATLPEEHLAQLAARLQPRHRAKGETVFAHGDPGNALYIIRAGEVKISVQSPTDEEIILAVLGPDDAFGELAVLDGLPRSASATTSADTELLVLFRDDFMFVLQEEPALGWSILQSLAGIIRRTNEKLSDVAMLDVYGRVNKTLRELAKQYGQEVPGGILIDRPITNDYLAGLTGLYPVEVSRVLRLYEYEKIIERDLAEGRITLRDLARLPIRR